MKMEQEQIDRFIASYHPAKFACKKNGVVSSYSANTHQGIVRNYNEDRVSIILNIIKPKFKQVDEWPRCSFFAIYDGHGGAACADYLRDQLH
jgi:serine/threonine protein phosphatase PrpC